MSFHIIYLNAQGKAQMKLGLQKQCFLLGRQPMREKEIEEVMLFFLVSYNTQFGCSKMHRKIT